MLQQIFNQDSILFYILSAELGLLILLQLRTNSLLKRGLKMRTQKKKTAGQLKEEIKGGTSEIPVVKFEKPKVKMDQKKKEEKKEGYDSHEMEVLQEMMSEFFADA